MTEKQNCSTVNQPSIEEQSSSNGRKSDWQDIEISQLHDVAPQELVAESLKNHLIVIHTTPQPVEVVERADSLRFQGYLHKPSTLAHPIFDDCSSKQQEWHHINT